MRSFILFSIRLFFLSLALAGTETAFSQPGIITGKSIPITRTDNLLQGRLYSPRYKAIEGSPYLTHNWMLGDVGIMDKTYTDLPLIYDIYLDELIFLFRKNTGLQYLRLNKDQITRFNLEDHQFIHLKYSAYQNTSLKEGFYELAFAGQVSLLVKRSTSVQIQSPELISYFSRKDTWFLIRDEQAFKIRSKKSFLEAVGEEFQKPMSTFIKKEKIKLRKAGDLEWLQLVRHLNSLQSKSI